MCAQPKVTSDVGSYLLELARRVVNSDRVPAQLVVDARAYQQCKEATVKNSAPMANLLEREPQLVALLTAQFGMQEASFASRNAFLWALAERAMDAEVPAALPVDRQLYVDCQKARISDLGPMVDLLAANPPLQEQLAFFFDYVPSRWLVEAEVPAVIHRRRLRKPDAAFVPANDIYEWACKNKVTGLCLSGGGIRSATFNLGILQGLAGIGLLGEFDYLSSVSGGGYIHEWLASWIKREDKRITEHGDADFHSGMAAVEDKIKPIPVDLAHPFSQGPIRWLRRYSNYLTPQKGLFTADTWVVIAIWIRNTFLNQIVLVSFLFFLTLLPHVIGGGYRTAKTLLEPVKAIAPQLEQHGPPVEQWPMLWSVLALALFAVASVSLCVGLRNEYRRVRHQDIHGIPPDEKATPRLGETAVFSLIILPLLLASFLFTNALVAGLPEVRTLWILGGAIAVQLAGMALAGGSMRVYRVNHGSAPQPKTTAPAENQHRSPLSRLWQGCTSAFHFMRASLLTIPSLQKTEEDAQRAREAASHWSTFFGAVLGVSFANSVLAALGGVGVFFVVACLLQYPEFVTQHLTMSLPVWVHTPTEISARWRLQLTFGPPLLLFVPFFSLVLMAGLVGHNFDDWLREWIARVRAWCLLISVGWIGFFGISLLGPWLFLWMGHEYTSHPHWIQSISWTAVLGWVFTTAGSVLAGKSKKSSGTADDSSFWLDLLAQVGPYVFIVGLALLLSLAADRMFEAQYQHPAELAALLLVPLAVFALFGWRVDVNDFSMNPFYRNRLTRCYLGATNPARDPNPLTGFDDRDTRDLQISKLQPSENYSGPLPIINTTLNISFGEDLAYQERKAASFFFSPLFSGYTVGWTSGKKGRPLSFNGFVPTSHYYSPDGGINIATAVAISGAAASPNGGFHTNPGTAFLMTLFNVRLGWWIFNPRRSQLAGCLPDCATTKPEWPSPRFAPLQLARELLGMADDTSQYVYLSDGGHFDNMGLYELVRRRCHRIVICDAECDEKYSFEGLGMAIRKCRVDFGVEIQLPNIAQIRQDIKSGNCKAHFTVGSIRYPESPANKSEWGTILYIKSSLTGSAKYEPATAAHPGKPISLDAESVDILNYKLQHSSFPHDTTANQWFTESQFESYRRLGQHVIEEIQCCSGWENFVPIAAPVQPQIPVAAGPEPVLVSVNGRDGDLGGGAADLHFQMRRGKSVYRLLVSLQRLLNKN